ncbi:MAG: DUF4294 domain-containing protein [Bacteroidales bacterium]|nr:DUF4294 domain-containing protein [Bacteroidales bacterium]
MKPFLKILLLSCIALLKLNSVEAQQADTNRLVRIGETYAYKATIEGKDTLILINLEPVNIIASLFPNTRYYRRLIYNVKKVYPYAKLASIKMAEYEYLLKKAETDKERRKLMKRAEKELKSEFGDELENLTFSQGKILLKLLDREVGTSSYYLVAELRGKFSAFMWQSLARLFGYNLKVKYDPNGRDWDIERVVRMIELGRI